MSSILAGKTLGFPFLVVLLFLVGVSGALAADDSPADADPTFSTGPVSLPAISEPDTVRTNVWLTEALMAEIITSTVHVLPSVPAAIQLVQRGDTPKDFLCKAAAVRVLGGLGYELYITDEDPTHQAAVDCIYSFQVQDVELLYPEVGRTLGLWRRWIDRELKITVQVDVTMANSGRMLLSDQVQRRFSDRVASKDFDSVNSRVYDFTTAEISESSWKGRMEEIVVLGTLAGLVAIYFANTGD
jgi:hypothetical protein